MATFVLYDRNSSVKGVCFSDVFKRYGRRLGTEAVEIEGVVNFYNGAKEIAVKKITVLKRELPRLVMVADDIGRYYDAKSVLEKYKGHDYQIDVMYDKLMGIRRAFKSDIRVSHDILNIDLTAAGVHFELAE